MALIFADGFEQKSLSQMGSRYNSTGGGGGAELRTASGRNGQYLMLSNHSHVKRFTNTTSIVVGIARKVDSVWSERDFLKLDDTDGNRQLTLREMADGTIRLYRGDPAGAGVLLATSAAITPGFWVYYELKVVVHSTAGSYEFRANETSLFSGSNVNTQATIRQNIERVTYNGQLTSGGTLNDNHVDDFYIADFNSPFPAGYFLGNIKVTALFPNANAFNSWTASGAANWQNVSDNQHDSDTTYNYTGTVNATDFYNIVNPNFSDGRIRGLQVSYAARKDDAILRATAPALRIGSTNYLGGNDSLTTSYVYYMETWPQNPATSSEWEYSAINDLMIGIITTS